MYRKFLSAAFAVVLTIASLAPAEAVDTSGPAMFALVAANATAPFNDLISAFIGTHPGVTIKANMTGTQILQQQLENGAPCDIFLSADLPHIVKLHAEGLVGSYHQISRTHEVIVVPATGSANITALGDLGKPNVKLIIGVPDVPIGAYTRQIFKSADSMYGADFDTKALANVVSLEVNTKQVLQKVVLNEADAGIVYQTDVDPVSAKAVRVIQIPSKLNVDASNYIAVATKASNPALAQAFVNFALSADGQAIFAKYGYDPRQAR